MPRCQSIFSAPGTAPASGMPRCQNAPVSGIAPGNAPVSSANAPVSEHILARDRRDRQEKSGTQPIIDRGHLVNYHDGMPRTARTSVGALWYHALNRGNRREAVFHRPGEYSTIPFRCSVMSSTQCVASRTRVAGQGLEVVEPTGLGRGDPLL